jgi:Cu(I)/Ag(I) efflux system membrane fusion protein
MKRVASICAALSFIVVAAGGGGDVLAQGSPSPSAATGGTPLYYQDPDGKPAYSPIPKKTEDGRNYIPVYEEAGAPAAASPTKPAAGSPGKGRILYYRNPMGLPDTSPVPKKDSMGMDYIPVYESGAEPGVITVAPGRLQLLGVRIAPVERRPALTHTARATATVAFDERRFAVVTTKVAGWVEKLDVSATGDPVRQGQALAWIYSPELVAAEEEYLLVAHIPHSGGGHGDLTSLGIAALRRLRALDIPEEEIARLRRSGTVSRRIAVLAPTDGVVIEKPVVAGMRIAAGEPLYKIADLSTVWLIAEVQESDIGFVRSGEKSRASAVAFPGRTFDGVVDFVYPTLSRDTRTARVRIVVPNQDLALRGDMYASVEIDAPTGREAVLAVPESAVIDSGACQVVLVERGEGRFAPRAVKVGTRGEGYVQILEGVQEGERVVVGANFLIDAESNLRAALEGFAAGSQGAAK